MLKFVNYSMQFSTSLLPMRGFAIIEYNPLSVGVDETLPVVTAGNLQEKNIGVMQVF